MIDLSPEEITNALQLNKLKDRLWYVVPSVATEGTGIFEGLVRLLFVCVVCVYILTTIQAWLSNNVKTPAPAK